jgi:CRISPR-associated protein (TIGR03984 family)
MIPATLAIFTAESFPLDACVTALKSLLGEVAIGILYDPTSCMLARLNGDGRLCGPEGDAIDVSGVFEARIFRDSMELRWHKDASSKGRHRAVIIAESEINLSSMLDDQWKPLEIEVPVVDTLDQTYLLWGEGTENPPGDGWSELAAARIGAMPVPISGVGPNARVILRTREYLAEYEHGNVAVLDERLMRLEVVRA